MKTYIEPEEAWDYFREHIDDFDEYDQVLVEEDDEGVQVVMGNNNGEPCIYIVEGETYSLEGTFSTAGELEGYLAGIYVSMQNGYFDDDSYGLDKLGELDDEEAERFEIELRESELNDAALDYLMAVDSEHEFDDEEIKRFMNDSLYYLYKELGLHIYRPKYLVGDDGQKTFEEHPYEKL